MGTSSTRYLIVGGGMTADAAAEGIRRHDAEGAIALVSAELHPPYARPPLTKKLWAGGDEAKIWRGTAERGVELVLGRRIVELDLDGHRAVDDAGRGVRLREAAARDGRPAARARRRGRRRRLLPDARRLPGSTRPRRSGGELRRGRRRLHRLGDRRGADGRRIARDHGVPGSGDRRASLPGAARAVRDRLLPRARRRGADGRDGRVGARRRASPPAPDAWSRPTSSSPGSGSSRQRSSPSPQGFPVDNGIVVDEYGRVGGRDDVFAAGDVANFPIPALGKNTRVEHEDHANSHGRAVGANMAGAGSPTTTCRSSTPTCSTSATRRWARSISRLATVERWDEPNRKGVVAYVDDERRPRGFLLWDTWGKVDAARDLIRAGKPIDEGMLV